MKRGWMIVLLLSLGVNLGLGLSLLRPSHSPPPPSSEVAPEPEIAPEPGQTDRFLRHRLDRMDRTLHLAPQQREALWSLHRDLGREIVDRREEVREARARLHQAYADSGAEAAALHRILRTVNASQTELDSLVIEVMLREREILTPEQRRHYQSLFPMGPRRHPRHESPGPARAPRPGRRRVE